jgi:pyruvate/2-oxoglutarate dehydrogenase complex dihydrolipoamide acyltransferase (E2) component
MPIDIKLPELGEGITSGDVLEVLVAVGDTIAKDQGIVELETEKATISVPASQAGVVSKIHVSVGDTVNVGQPLISVEASAKTASEKPAPAAKPTSAKPVEPPSPASLLKQPPRPRLHVQRIIAPPTAQPTTAAERVGKPPATKSRSASRRCQPWLPPREPTTRWAGRVAAGPSIRRFAHKWVSIYGRSGSGPGGRISREDILQVVRSGSSMQRSGTPAPNAAGQQDNYGPVRTEKMSRIRRTIAEKMHLSWTTVPRVTNFDDTTVSGFEALV